MLHSKKGVSPLVATILLILFSIVLGAVVMSWGEAYIEEKAEFVKGAQETVAGCDAAYINIIKVSGELEICYKDDDILEVWIENGPTTELYDIHARIVGTEKATTRDSILIEPLRPADARKVMFRFEPVGFIRQVKLTPIIMRAGTLTPCVQKAITVENVHPCQ
ncbi:hypothetical protein KY333_03915 [Candidatus Woesearchaeota archaeon]|nr:hypothetical protein [Candidatus Woesearchaeota archaeon]